jgi:MFS family permease
MSLLTPDSTIINPLEANPKGRKRRTLWSVYLGVASTILISQTGSLMLPVAAAEIGGADIWSMALTAGSPVALTCMPLFGYLTARSPHIRRPMFVICFIIASACIFMRAAATNMWMIILPSFILTLYSPCIYVIGYSTVRDMYGKDRAGTLLGLIVTMQGIGLLAGPALGGLIIQFLGWRAINILIGSLLLITALLFLSGARITKEEGQTVATSGGKFDVLGAVSISIMLASLIIVLSMTRYFPWGSPVNITLIVVFIIGFIAFAGDVKKKGTEAFLPVPVLKDGNTRYMFLINFLFTFSAMGIGAFLAQYMMNVQGHEPGLIGPVNSIYAVASLFMGPIFGRLIAKKGTAREVVMYGGGLLRCAVQLGFFFLVGPTTPIYVIFILMFIGGFYASVGGVMPAVAPQIQLREDIRPLGNSMIQAAGPLGSTVGISIFTAVNASLGIEQGFKVMLIITSLISILDFVFALPLKKLPDFVEKLPDNKSVLGIRINKN